jgi:4-alpha-glucanotransferase
MNWRRGSGVLLHVSSLPGRHGIGDLGPEAFKFVDLLARARQSIWQILPLGPTGYGDSPYQCYSAFAGNPLFISLEKLVEDGLLDEASLKGGLKFPQGTTDFERVTPWRMERLHEAFGAMARRGHKKLSKELEAFCEAEKSWLDEFSLFMALRDQWPNGSWTAWPPELRRREEAAIRKARKEFSEGIAFHKFVQFLFARQWNEVHQYAKSHGIAIMGDVPIFVSHESSDVWANQSQFQLDRDGRPTKVAGVPPDYFSETGQRWGNPVYRWDVMEKQGFQWWIHRMEGTLKLVDWIRLDHFRGFEAYWEIPAEAPTAATGQWIPGPREKLFHVLKEKLGTLPIIAEDLGVITPPVEQLRDMFHFPGMRVLQFAFSGDNAPHRPHNYVRNCVAYTGTHDNDTTVGWFNAVPGVSTTQSAKEVALERKIVRDYLPVDGHEIHWEMIRAVWRSVAGLAVAPLQDVLGLGSEARMNMPGTASGNWRWRLKPGQLKTAPMVRLAELTEVYDRARVGDPEPEYATIVARAARKRKAPTSANS